MKTKFNAYIPQLNIILENVAVYGNGHIGIGSDEFQEVLPKNCHIDHDNSKVYMDFINDDEDEDFENKFSIDQGDEWIFIDSPDYILLTFIGINDRNNNPIFTGHIIESDLGFQAVVEDLGYDDSGYYGYILNSTNPKFPKRTCINKLFEPIRIVGNFYTNK